MSFVAERQGLLRRIRGGSREDRNEREQTNPAMRGHVFRWLLSYDDFRYGRRLLVQWIFGFITLK
jgi:hypothetical protein